MIKNAYVHIPFCKSKCHYCSFVSFCDLSAKGAYLDALKLQIKAEYCDGGLGNPPYAAKLKAGDLLTDDVGVETPTYCLGLNCEKPHNTLNTLYFGGGTPSLLSIDEFKSLIDLFEFEPDAEITVEVNPDSVDFEYLSALRALGVNRLSIGVQTFDDKILKLIGRRHNSQQAKAAVDAARRAAFDNISVDLIYGLPSQTIDGFEQDLRTVIGLGIQHVSLYGLKIESESYFGKNLPQNLPDLDLQADMYLKAIEVLTSNGFEHYEISNFALKGFESKHNLNYWDANTYYGFGCAASGYCVVWQECPTTGEAKSELNEVVGLASPTYIVRRPRKARIWNLQAQQYGIRYQNESELEKYIQNPLSKIFQEKLSKQNQLEEAIFLGLRKIAGIDVQKINAVFGIDFNEKYAQILKKFAEFFTKTSQGYALNEKGILISNEILAEFID